MSQLTDEQRRQHFSELGQRAVEARRARKAAVERLVRETRKAQGLPPTIEDTVVLERLADLMGGGEAA
jgi:hypothetical protein